MKFDYLARTGESVIVQGTCAANSVEQAQSYVFSLLKGRRVPNLVIEIEGHITFFGSKLFERPIAKKVDHRPKLPWNL